MLAFQRPPRALTDRELFEGQGTLADQFGDEATLNGMLKIAKSQGFTPGANDIYNSALADFPGDKKAYIPPTGGRGYIEKVCREKGVPCDGLVKVEGREPERDPLESAPSLSPRIVDEEIRSRTRRDPSLALKDQGELRHEIVAKHGAK
jgi:hypothetical protein